MYNTRVIILVVLALMNFSSSAFADIVSHINNISQNITEESAESLYISTRRGRDIPNTKLIEIGSEAIDLIKSVAYFGNDEFFESIDEHGSALVRSCKGAGIALVAKIGIERCLVALVTKNGLLKAKRGTQYEVGASLGVYAGTTDSVEIKGDSELDENSHYTTISSVGYLGVGGRFEWLDLGFNHQNKLQGANLSSLSYGLGGSWIEISYSFFDGDDEKNTIELQLKSEFVELNL